MIGQSSDHNGIPEQQVAAGIQSLAVYLCLVTPATLPLMQLQYMMRPASLQSVAPCWPV
jgi:hypothetical protein